MLFLILSILSSALVFITFKIINQQKINILSTIIINYFVACSAGFFLSNNFLFSIDLLYQDWIYLSVIEGILFILMLYLIGKSTSKAGVTITTLASKISVVFPIVFSIWIDNSTLTTLNILGIIITIAAVYLALHKKLEKSVDLSTILLPLMLFIGIGLVDSLIKFAQAKYISNELNPVFSAVTFGFAGLAGLLLLPFNKEALNSYRKSKTWILGIVLGLVNFGTVYFLIGALNHTDPSTGLKSVSFMLFGINNMSIVAVCALVGLIVFKEKLTVINWAGLLLSILAIFMLTY